MHGSMYVKLQKRHRYRKRIYAIAHQTLIIVEIRPKTKKKKESSFDAHAAILANRSLTSTRRNRREHRQDQDPFP